MVHRLLQTAEGAERVLILGAGQAGEALVRDLRRTGRYDPIGFLDDSVVLRGNRLQSLPVLGKMDDLRRRARETGQKRLPTPPANNTDHTCARIGGG